MQPSKIISMVLAFLKKLVEKLGHKPMEIELQRGNDNTHSTIGKLYIDSILQCYALEDTHREIKVQGKTRIPAGRYEIKLRNQSALATKYRDKYSLDGMIWLQDVKNFTYVYIHIGNDEKDTNGCILVGKGLNRIIVGGSIAQKITHSTDAYRMIHPKIATAIQENRKVFITILD